MSEESVSLQFSLSRKGNKFKKRRRRSHHRCDKKSKDEENDKKRSVSSNIINDEIIQARKCEINPLIKIYDFKKILNENFSNTSCHHISPSSVETEEREFTCDEFIVNTPFEEIEHVIQKALEERKQETNEKKKVVHIKKHRGIVNISHIDSFYEIPIPDFETLASPFREIKFMPEFKSYSRPQSSVPISSSSFSDHPSSLLAPDEVLLRVSFFHSNPLSFNGPRRPSLEFHVLGSTTLTSLKDCILCFRDPIVDKLLCRHEGNESKEEEEKGNDIESKNIFKSMMTPMTYNNNEFLPLNLIEPPIPDDGNADIRISSW